VEGHRRAVDPGADDPDVEHPRHCSR
jgi:hypothetical protein